MSIEKHIDVLKSQACQDALTLLGYIPSFKGKLKRKEEEEREPSKKAGVKKKGGEKWKGESQLAGGSKKGKEPRVKFPTFRKPVEFWFQKSQQAELSAINIPLWTIIPDSTEGLSWRNVVRVNLRDGISAWASEPEAAEPQEKRQKTHNFFPARPPTPCPPEKEPTESSAAGGSKAVQKSVGSTGYVVAQEFTPSFALAKGRLGTIDDGVKTELGLAVTMLRGLALPKDMERVPKDL